MVILSVLFLILCINITPEKQHTLAFIQQPVILSSRIIYSTDIWKTPSYSKNGKLATTCAGMEEGQDKKSQGMEYPIKELIWNRNMLFVGASLAIVTAFFAKTITRSGSTVDIMPPYITSRVIAEVLSIFLTFTLNGFSFYLPQASTTISIMQFITNFLFPVALKNLQKLFITEVWKRIWEFIYQRIINYMQGPIFFYDKEEQKTLLMTFFPVSLAWLYKGIQKIFQRRIEKKIQSWFSSLWQKSKKKVKILVTEYLLSPTSIFVWS